MTSKTGDAGRGAGVEIVKHAPGAPRVESWAARLARQTREHPGRFVAMAVGVGYVLGGGLFSRLTARILGTAIRIGLRTALLPFVTEGLLVLGQKHTYSEGNVNNENE